MTIKFSKVTEHNDVIHTVASGTIDGAAPIKFCSFFLTLIEEKGTINVLGSIETHIKIV